MVFCSILASRLSLLTNNEEETNKKRGKNEEETKKKRGRNEEETKKKRRGNDGTNYGQKRTNPLWRQTLGTKRMPGNAFLAAREKRKAYLNSSQFWSGLNVRRSSNACDLTYAAIQHPRPRRRLSAPSLFVSRVNLRKDQLCEFAN